jgi:hypothetical protein
MLSLHVYGRSAFIDGIHLENEMLIYLSKLEIFKFNIITYNENMSNEIHIVATNEEMKPCTNYERAIFMSPRKN